jgi:hypothetical protein
MLLQKSVRDRDRGTRRETRGTEDGEKERIKTDIKAESLEM